MEPKDLDDLLTVLFQRLRAAGVPLGLPELLDARRALEADRGAAGPRLKRILQLLWCTSAAHNAELEAQLERLLAERPMRADPMERDETPPSPPSATEPPHQPAEVPSSPPPQLEPRPMRALMPLPVRAPDMPAPLVDDAMLISADPVSRRSMAYSWHYLRRPVKDGPRDQLDLPATIDRAARQGYFDQPVLERRVTDHSHLVVLLDQGGSMVPFHHLTRELVETLNDAGLGRVDIGYFQNTPAAQVYMDAHRTRPTPLKDLLAECGVDSSILVVSDAGAARGGRDQTRFRASARVLVGLKQRTARLAWLNPVPSQRWAGTTAQLIGAIVDMFPIDEDGFSNAVDRLRGQLGWRPR
ncbi:hypothetical protein [Rhabdochromatium marinum]|uniref:hypothetical protein n=1 Tax=Rhabdochromatium marinum TaxID=48729 RepID=UPI001907A840|nr:hypothetical protein [Rhabdochromatium marinum]